MIEMGDFMKIKAQLTEMSRKPVDEDEVDRMAYIILHQYDEEGWY